MQFFYISSKNLIENKIISNTKFHLNSAYLINFELNMFIKELKFFVLNSFYFLTGFNIRLFCLIIVFTIFIMFAGLLIAENPYLAVKVYFDN